MLNIQYLKNHDFSSKISFRDTRVYIRTKKKLPPVVRRRASFPELITQLLPSLGREDGEGGTEGDRAGPFLLVRG